MKKQTLAVDGGKKIRTLPMPKKSVIQDEEYRSLLSVLEEARTTGKGVGYNGQKEAEYTEKFCEYMGGGFADAVCSGTNALFVALGALDIDPFSEIIVAPWTDPGGVMPVVFCACIPMMADSHPGSFNMGIIEIEKMITPRTRAIIVSHIGGEAVDMEPVLTLAKEKKLLVIEDCAQSFGATCRDSMIGTFGDIAIFSTMYTKHVASGGQGGLVYTKSRDLYWEIKRFADRGKSFNLPTLDGRAHAPLDCDVNEMAGNVRAGLNCNTSELACAIGLEQIRKLPTFIARRQQFGETLKERLLKKSSWVRLGWQAPHTKSSYWFLRFYFEKEKAPISKEEFCRALIAEGIPVKTTWRKIPCEMPWFQQKRVFGKSGFPWTCSEYKGEKNPQFTFDNIDKAVEEHFTLPINENFGSQELDDILEAICKIEDALSSFG